MSITRIICGRSPSCLLTLIQRKEAAIVSPRLNNVLAKFFTHLGSASCPSILTIPLEYQSERKLTSVRSCTPSCNVTKNVCRSKSLGNLRSACPSNRPTEKKSSSCWSAPKSFRAASKSMSCGRMHAWFNYASARKVVLAVPCWTSKALYCIATDC